jgi:hypothetical protein
MIFLWQSLLIPWLIGLLFLALFEEAPGYRAFNCFLAAGLGLGICSSAYFLLLVVRAPWRHGIALIEYALLAALAAANLYWWRKRRRSEDKLRDSHNPPLPAAPAGKPSWMLLLSVAAVVVLAAAAFLVHLSKYPHGGWDAWAIWNLRARFLFRGGQHWRDAFTDLISWSHPDYPLLVPGLVARCWEYMGRESLLAGQGIGAMFTLAAAGLLLTALAALRGWNQALVGSLALVGTPLFISSGASQYADVPICFFVLASLALLVIEGRDPRRHWSLAALAGLAAGFAAWTKNEGLLFVLAIVVARFATFSRREGIKSAGKRCAPLLLGLTPPLLLVLYFKLSLAPPTDIFAASGLAQRLLDPSRYGFVAASFFLQTVSFGGWFITPVLLLAIYGFCLGVKVDAVDRPAVSTVGIALALTIAGYAAIYVVTPLDLGFHIATSIDRLQLQVWPSLLLLYFLVIRAPERVSMDRKKRKKKAR